MAQSCPSIGSGDSDSRTFFLSSLDQRMFRRTAACGPGPALVTTKARSVKLNRSLAPLSGDLKA